jgi:hypothetical protein
MHRDSVAANEFEQDVTLVNKIQQEPVPEHQALSSLRSIPIDHQEPNSWLEATQSDQKLYSNIVIKNVVLQFCPEIETFYRLVS